MKTIGDPSIAAEYEARVRRVTADSPRQFGTMTPGEMLCHLADSFDAVLGQRPLEQRATFASRTVVKFVALHVPLKWPVGVKTGKTVDPRREGTKPTDITRDADRLVASMRRFTAAVPTMQGPHPLFGPLSANEWYRWGTLHMQHHLRQFAV